MTEIDLVNAKLITSNCKVTLMTRTPLKYKEILLPLHIPYTSNATKKNNRRRGLFIIVMKIRNEIKMESEKR
jgi:hypothetical protein